MSLWLQRARSVRVFAARGRLKEAFVEACYIMEVLQEWRVWSKQMLWMRKQQEMAGLLAQAGAQLVQASAHEVHRGRSENNSRRLLQHAAGRILDLQWISSVSRAFVTWPR